MVLFYFKIAMKWKQKLSANIVMARPFPPFHTPSSLFMLRVLLDINANPQDTSVHLLPMPHPPA